jgi:hypothetical protein
MGTGASHAPDGADRAGGGVCAEPVVRYCCERW